MDNQEPEIQPVQRILADASPSTQGKAREILVRGLIGITERIQTTWMGYAQEDQIYALSLDLSTGHSSCGCAGPHPCVHIAAFAMLLVKTGSSRKPGKPAGGIRTGSEELRKSPETARSSIPARTERVARLERSTETRDESSRSSSSSSSSSSSRRQSNTPANRQKASTRSGTVEANKKSLPLSFRLNEQTEKLKLSSSLAVSHATLEERLIPEHRTIWKQIQKHYAFPYEIPLREAQNWHPTEPVEILDLNHRRLEFQGTLQAKPVLRGFSNRKDPRRVLVPCVIAGDEERWLKPGQNSLIEAGGSSRSRKFWLLDYSGIESGIESRLHSVLSPGQIIASLDSLRSAGVQGLELFSQCCEYGPALRISLDYSIDTDLWLHGSLDMVYAGQNRDLRPDYLEEQPDARVQRPVYRTDAKFGSIPLDAEFFKDLADDPRPAHHVIGEEGRLVWRNPELEFSRFGELQDRYSILQNDSLAQDGTFWLSGEDLHRFFVLDLPSLIESGVMIDFDRELPRLFRAATKVKFDIEKPSGIDWFSGSIDLPGLSRQEQDRIFKAYREGRSYAKIKNDWMYIPDTGLPELLEMLLDLGLKIDSQGKVDIRRTQWMALESELGEQLQTHSRKHRARALKERKFKKSRSSGFTGKLRPYQKEGFEFLSRLYGLGVGGLLADEMGLGKTVQALAFLQRLFDSGEPGLLLVVCPVSALSVWAREAQRFTPTLPVQIWHGPGRKKIPFPDSGILLTTYNTLSKDLLELKKQSYAAAIVDEAQNLRNSQTDISRSIRRLDIRSVFCLTGTPMENHLSDYWSLMDLSVPGLLGTRQSFRRRFDANPDRVAYLRRLTAPFMLRRTKEAVLKELPGKTEIQSFLPMERKQATIYESVREEAMDHLQEAGSQYLMTMLPYLMRLRRIACHPEIEGTADPMESGKFQYLKDLLLEMAECNPAALIFSQFTDVLDIAAILLDNLKLPYFRIDGSTGRSSRDKQVLGFQNGERSFFLISLKAGGTALTLHRADRVIHLDPWWNPAAESQATDRAHRIGQKKHLFVYKLYSRDTIEERVLELQSKKKVLFNSLFSGNSGGSLKISRSELLKILGS